MSQTDETQNAEMTGSQEKSTENKVQEEKSIALDVFFAQKAGMTRIFNKDGKHVPVTVLKIIPNYISQVKTEDSDGYSSYQLAFGEKREKLVNAPKKGTLKNASIELSLTKFSEVRLGSVDLKNLGARADLSNFSEGDLTNISGQTKGKGFAGVMKKYNFSGGPAAHGSKFHRTTGSIGNRATPGRVFKGKKMPGHMGAENQTVKNLKLVEINLEKGYILVKGSVPGYESSFVRVAKAK